jgi:putative transposase
VEKGFCVDALKKALSVSRPEIFNSVQGSQYTREQFIEVLEERNIDVSMDGIEIAAYKGSQSFVFLTNMGII